MGNDETFIEQDVTEKSFRGRHPVPQILAGVLLVEVLVVAAFVGVRMQSGKKSQEASTASSSDPEKALLAFSQCMRDNGVPNFPEPVGDGINLAGTGIDRNTPEFKAAQEACEPLLPQRSAGTSDSAWQKILPGGDTECANGSEFAFWERKVNSEKVVLYLDGGVCFDAASCANANTANTRERAGPDYDPNIEGENPAGERGMFDFTRADNPFLDYSFIYVPLCTADSHLGDVTREYSPELIVEHNGFVNGTAALNYLAENYSEAAQVVVVGKTAGSVAALIYGGLVADLLPDVQVTVFGASPVPFRKTRDSTSRSSVSYGARSTTCRTGRATKDSPQVIGDLDGSGSRLDSIIPISSWPASTMPSTLMRWRR